MSKVEDVTKFLDVLAHSLHDEARFIMCAFRGDPDEAPTNAWRPRPWKPDNDIPFTAKNNAYITVSSFGRVADGGFRRRRDTFKAGHALMVDDVGTKVDLSVVKKVRPTAIVETSPGNQQWWYVLKQAEPDYDKFDAVIRAFIRMKLLGNDPGMAGVTRVGRLPGFTNGKAKHNKFITKLEDLQPKRLFTIDQLVKAFNLELLGRRMAPAFVPSDEAEARIKAFFDFQTFLQKRKMFKRRNSDPSGWQEMHCPWKDGHTNAADTGAAIREPHLDNQYYGAFRCHHGSCAHRGWRELTEWISDQAVEEVN